MSVFPPELWLKIFPLACTDGGGTGRALRLVSSAFRDLVHPFALQSLAVQGPKQILRFEYMLEHSPAAQGAILYLYLSSEHPRMASGSSFRKTDTDWYVMVSTGWLDDLAPFGTAKPGAITVQHIENAVARIINLVGPTLVTLSLHFTFLTRPSLLPEASLPRLEQLLVYGNYRALYRSSSNTPKLPSLWYLHISSPTRHPDEFIIELRHRAPALTHLFISEKCFAINRIASAMGTVDDTNLTLPGPRVLFPKSLTTIFLEVEEGVTRRAESIDDLATIDEIDHIDHFRRWAGETGALTGLSIHIVPRYFQRWDDVAVAMKDWDERIAFGTTTGKGWRFES